MVSAQVSQDRSLMVHALSSPHAGHGGGAAGQGLQPRATRSKPVERNS